MSFDLRNLCNWVERQSSAAVPHCIEGKGLGAMHSAEASADELFVSEETSDAGGYNLTHVTAVSELLFWLSRSGSLGRVVE